MMTDKIDISPEAVERLALDHDIVGNDPIKYVMGHPHHWKTAKTLRALSARIAELEADVDEAQEELIAAQGQIADAQAAEARFIEQRGSLVSVTKKLAKTEARLAKVIKKWSAAESEAYDLRAAIPRVYQMALDAASVYCEKLDLGWKDRAGLQVYPSATYCAVAIRALTPPADLVQQATKGTDHE